MAKVVLDFGRNRFHFHLGSHKAAPKPRERIDPAEIDALVIEDGLAATRQASALVREMHKLGKPVYYVENLKLKGAVDRRIFLGQMLALLGAGWAYIGAGGRRFLDSKTGESAAGRTPEQNAEVERAMKPVRKHLAGIARAGYAVGGAGALISTDYGRTLPQMYHGARLRPRQYSVADLNAKFARDVNGSVDVAKRNAIIAEGLVRLAARHRRLGVVVGAGHYNLPFYLMDDAMRHKIRAGVEPEIRMVERF